MLAILILPLSCKKAPEDEAHSKQGPSQVPSHELEISTQVATEFAVLQEDTPILLDVESLQKSVAAEPENLMMRFNLLAALDREQRYEEALEEARHLASIEENNPYLNAASLNFASLVLDKLPHDRPDRASLLNEALAFTKTALEFDPGSVPLHLAFGRLGLEIGNENLGLHHLSIALAGSEIGYKLRIRMAEIYIQRNDFPKARAHLQEAKALAEAANDKKAVKKINALLRRAS